MATMCEDVKISRRGVYYDLNLSPYEYQTPYGDIFKFRSQKRLDIYAREVVKEVERVDSLIDRNELRGFIPPEVIELIKRTVYKAFYVKQEG